MRILNGLLCLVLILFAVAQYNDPDALLWGAIYGIAAVWSGVAAVKPQKLTRPQLRALWSVCALAGLAGLVWYWPDAQRWWVIEVWWETETAREGMGMMIVVLALVAAGLPAMLRRAPA